MSQNTASTEKNRYLQNNLEQNREIIRSLKTRQDEKRSLAEKIADFMTAIFGSIVFLLINVIWFAIWIVINLKIIPGSVAFDPFPFGLLTMIVSLEAIVLAIFVLISQNRSSKIADLREEIDLQVDMLTERELTKVMHLVCAIAEKQGIDLTQDKELQIMLEPTSMSKIEHALEKQVIGMTQEGSKSDIDD
ncbi:MAG: DUF1003 domain-containing protein [Anaerolineae bacterium]|nr:DUF1003 domain-containing protein [Anaerolineae bacterium]